ncbi:MAG: hypothetical protein U9M98_03085 [Patescibacteria group bacterium]|nr:hypothetical protein [Patescibacteria group bacterium]
MHFNRWDNIYQKIAPQLIEKYKNNYTLLISGQRAAQRKELLKIKDLKTLRYGADLKITDHFLSRNKKVKSVNLENLYHVNKTEKWGLQGVSKDLNMWKDIIETALDTNTEKLLTQGYKKIKS